MVKGSADSVYASYGMVGNLLNELGNVIRGDGVSPSDEEIESFIYQEGSVSEKSKYFGNSKDKNVVVVLSESLEWYAFRKNEEMYPNALDFTEEELALLYPNLTKFYEDSVVMTNFHSKEKTDISETLSIVGQYPTGKYVTYDFYANAMPQSLPNILDEIWPSSSQFRSYHNGDKKFYNRHITHKSFGFDEYTAREDMRKMDGAKGENPVFTDWKEEVDDYNLDSEMIELCKDEMFPTDKRFFTYITTITMHGVYGDRQTLQDAKEEVEAVLGDRMPDKDAKEDEDAYRLFNYMVTAKELDKAVGCMVADLEKKGLLDKTTIMLFGDHEAYYDEMSSKVKDIFDYDTDRNFTDLYNVPLMIRDADLKEKVVESEGDRFVDKFVCTADLMPTLLDLLGIRYFSNLYYGRSAFLEKESVIYSRSYNFFMTDGIVGRSVEGFLYKRSDITPMEIAAYQEEAKITVEKVRYCDYIFRKNFFAKEKNMTKFLDKMAEING
jgi:phosphoglycerol transferase MdoB-like AlkP superfamily enzyme